MYRHGSNASDKNSRPEDSAMATSRPAAAKPERIVVVGMTLDMYAQNALEYYKDEIHRDGDHVILVYCHNAMAVVANAALPKHEMENLGQQETKRIDTARKMLENRLQKLHLNGEVKVYLQEDPMTRLTLVAEERKAKLIVIGSRNLGRELGKLLQSHSPGIVENSNIPVLIWKPGLIV